MHPVMSASQDLVVKEPQYEEIPHLPPGIEEPIKEEKLDCLSDDEIESVICMECGANTLKLQEYYMLHDDIWESIVPEHYRRGGLCIGCVEFFLGRELVSTDFTEAPVNYLGPKSERLLSRLGAYFVDSGGPFETPEEALQAAETLAQARNLQYGRKCKGSKRR